MRKLDMYIQKSDELRKLILDNPDLPIVVDCETELCSDDCYSSWVAPNMRCEVGEILDCQQDINDERIYFDRSEFENDLTDKLDDYDEKLSEDEFDQKVQSELKKYEPYWTKVIFIHATT